MTWTTSQMAFDSPPPSSQLLNYTPLRVDSFESTRRRKKRLSGTMEEESSFRECRSGRISEKKEKKLVDLDCFFFLDSFKLALRLDEFQVREVFSDNDA